MASPTTSIKAVTVYCSSSSSVAPVHGTAAKDLGAQIAQNGWDLVYGGNRIGIMGTLADASRSAGGRVIGITPELFISKGVGDDMCHELIVAESMRHRKALMEARGDAFIALPGGLGTLEEIFEIIVGYLLGYHAKPIVLLNIGGYYNPLLAMIDHGIEQHFIKPNAREAYFVAANVEEAIRHLKLIAANEPIPARNPLLYIVK